MSELVNARIKVAKAGIPSKNHTIISENDFLKISIEYEEMINKIKRKYHRNIVQQLDSRLRQEIMCEIPRGKNSIFNTTGDIMYIDSINGYLLPMMEEKLKNEYREFIEENRFKPIRYSSGPLSVPRVQCTESN